MAPGFSWDRPARFRPWSTNATVRLPFRVTPLLERLVVALEC